MWYNFSTLMLRWALALDHKGLFCVSGLFTKVVEHYTVCREDWETVGHTQRWYQYWICHLYWVCEKYISLLIVCVYCTVISQSSVISRDKYNYYNTMYYIVFNFLFNCLPWALASHCWTLVKHKCHWGWLVITYFVIFIKYIN